MKTKSKRFWNEKENRNEIKTKISNIKQGDECMYATIPIESYS